MKIIDTESGAWFLFEHEGSLYLDVNCNVRAFGYTYMIKLNEEELNLYQSGGRAYLGELAHDIHYSAPIAKDTKSIYQGRDVTNELSELSTEAVQAWRENGNA